MKKEILDEIGHILRPLVEELQTQEREVNLGKEDFKRYLL